MNEQERIVEYSQNNGFERLIGRFTIGAIAGSVSGAVGGWIGYEIMSGVMGRSLEAATVIAGPSIGIGLLYGIRAARKTGAGS